MSAIAVGAAISSLTVLYLDQEHENHFSSPDSSINIFDRN